jgi:hypothetical protein
MEVVFLGILFAAAIFLLFNFESDDTEYEKRKEKKKKKEKSFYSTYDDDDYWSRNDNSHKIEKIFNLIVKDFNNSPYNDKYEVKTISSLDYISFTYKFENGYTFSMISDSIFLYDRNHIKISSYTLNTHYYKIFLELVLEINQKSKSRYNQNSRQYYKRDYEQNVKEEPKVKSTGNPRLDKILEKIKLREEQLSKMSKNDPNRSSLINELETYKNVANKMKTK